MDTMAMLWQGLMVSLLPEHLLACIIGVGLGTLVGVLPGIGTVGAIALLLPFSYQLDGTAALIMFAGIYYGSKYGGSTTSILLNVPGETASVVTCLDGYAMARQGRAGAALTVAAVGSFVAGTLGLIGLTLFAPPLAQAALAFGPPEYFALSLVGLIILTRLTGKSLVKSALLAAVGVMLGTIGLDGLSGISRFTGGISTLDDGLELSLLAMGVFGIGELLTVMTNFDVRYPVIALRFKDLYPTRLEARRSIFPMLRGSLFGFLIGLLPGPSGTVSSFGSYAIEKKCSKQPELFGQGQIEGVAGPESANNAAVAAAMVPLLTLGLPFSGGTAMLLSGFMIHGIMPGPGLMTQQPELFWGLIASMYIGNVLLLILNLPLVGIFVQLLRTPLTILMPLVILLTLTGAYAINNSLFDVMITLLFGIFGFLLNQAGYEPAPLIVGFVLGPELEQRLVQGLIICDGSFYQLCSRPLTAVILSIGVVFFCYAAYCQWQLLSEAKAASSASE